MYAFSPHISQFKYNICFNLGKLIFRFLYGGCHSILYNDYNNLKLILLNLLKLIQIEVNI